MYDATTPPRHAGRDLGPPGSAEQDDRARLALARVRKLLAGFLPGMGCDHDRLLAALAAPLRAADQERERPFARAWLLWLDGKLAEALPLLADVEARLLGASDEAAKELLARSAYWLARVRLRLHEDALSPYEMTLRKLGGSPQATAWFVDLLWRAGRSDRAEQVWKSVRTNRRVLACDEGPLLDARLHLRRGELGPAEKLLREMTPRSGVVMAERHLLLAWLLTAQRKADRAADELVAAATCPYPAAALEEWKRLVADRLAGKVVTLDPLPPGWRDFAEAQSRRARGEESADTYRVAAAVPAVAPFARYGLLCLGEDQAEALLPAAPGLFFAQRLRAHHAIDRYRRRDLGGPALLEVLRQAGYRSAAVDHFRALVQGTLTLDGTPPGPERDNAALAAIAQGRDVPVDGLSSVVTDYLDRRRRRKALLDNDPAALPEDIGPLVAESRPLTQAVALHAAASGGDTARVAELLTDAEAWRGLARPPRFVVAALEALVLHQPGNAGLNRAIAAWASSWPAGGLGSALLGQGGDEAPPDAPPAWWLHQAARALLRDDPLAAWRAVQHAETDAAPLVRRRAEAAGIAHAFPDAGVPGERLLGLVDALREAGADTVLDAAARGDAVAVRTGLLALTEPPALHHPLAVLFWRGLDADDLKVTEASIAWKHWLALLADSDEPALLDHLFGWHRAAVREALAQGRLEAARHHWNVVQGVPSLTSSEVLAEALKARVAQFRDDLATEYLVHTRDVMRHAEAPDGWRADYDRGLTLLRRLLSLDRDNVRLLTAIVETCAEWFLDFYNTEDAAGMYEQVTRHLPLANHLARLIADRPGELSARAALSEFTKFRGFLERDEDARAVLYREALKFNPNNENVRDLLADMEGGEQGDDEDEGDDD